MIKTTTISCRGYWDVRRAWNELLATANNLNVPKSALRRGQIYGSGREVVIPFSCMLDGESDEVSNDKLMLIKAAHIFVQ